MHGLYVRVGQLIVRPGRDSDCFENDTVTAIVPKGCAVVGGAIVIMKDSLPETWRVHGFIVRPDGKTMTSHMCYVEKAA